MGFKLEFDAGNGADLAFWDEDEYIAFEADSGLSASVDGVLTEDEAVSLAHAILAHYEAS